MSFGHGGDIRNLARAAGISAGALLDFSANINPLGPPQWLRPVISSSIGALTHYPDPSCAELVDAIAARYGTGAECVLTGNGSTELLYLLPRAIPAARAIVPVPSYADYARAAEVSGVPVEPLVLREENGFVLDTDALAAKLAGRSNTRARDLVFIGQPNNPTGRCCDPEALRELARAFPNALFIVDEAFGDFVEGFESLTTRQPENVVVLLSLTKIFAIPGLRLGCALAAPELARAVRDIQPPWSVNTLAQAVGTAALRDAEYRAQTRAFVRARREELVARLQLPGLKIYPGAANFILLRIERGDLDAPELARRMLKHGVAIRVCGNFAGLDDRYCRVAVRTAEENARLCAALRDALGIAGPAIVSARPRARVLMFQGTSSDAGKSVLTAALCRILLQDGHRVAPFKAQNMSLNSFVTRDGGEMGRAQVVQAQACRLEPDVRMNPILLKPNSDTGSQVIVRGKPVGNMDVSAYIRYKPEAFAAAQRAFDELAREHDVVVLEGAGSPGEVNLKAHDIVNMSMARYANAPVLLVGDIDRGGVYASFVGTLEVLSEAERALVAGFVVNRFRGQASLLTDAHDYVLRHTGRPVLGVVPYLAQLGLPEEDSVAFKAGAFDAAGAGDAAIEVAVIDLPHISNFTDFDALRLESDVRVRIVRQASELGAPNVIILPGSKNVIADLAHLRRSGLEQKILELHAAGAAEIIGVCGGLQMLGETIQDPHQIESACAELRAMALLPVSTTLAREKTLTRVSATHLPTGLPLQGYEIHHGVTGIGTARATIRRDDGEIIGVSDAGGRVWGTYLHGLFDADAFRHASVERWRARKGLPPCAQPRARYDLEPALERLAETVRRSLQMDAIYELMGLRR